MKNALLIIDLQSGLFANDPVPHRIAEVIANINQLAGRARAAGAPVFLVQHEAAGTALAFDSPAWQLDKRLSTQPSDVRIRKTTSAPYASSDLLSQLQARSVSGVVVVGYATEFCVDSTVRWSASLGLTVTLVSDAHTTHDKAHLSAAHIVSHHNATLPCIQSLGAPIRIAESTELWPD